MTETKMNFWEKWNEVVKAAAYVQQTGRNAHHKYNYVTERDLLDAIRPTMTALGLLFYLVNTEIVPQASTGSLITIKTTYRVRDTESGEYEDIVVFGQGSDSQDKGVYKAHTGARKYAVRQFTLVATGDDPEEDSDSMDSIVDNPAAITVIHKLRDVGIDWSDDRITGSLGTSIAKIPNTKDGTDTLRSLYRLAASVQDGKKTVEEFFTHLEG